MLLVNFVLVGLFFLGITTIGFMILKNSLKVSNSFVLLPFSAILGISIYIFLLNLNSKLFPGLLGIALANIELFTLGLYIFKNYSQRRIFKIKFTLRKNKAFILICIVMSLLIGIKMISLLQGPDTSIQRVYAASFARGNYPLMVPWQADFSPQYHLGAYFFHGALFGLTRLTYSSVYVLTNFFLITNLFLISFFIFWEGKYGIKNVWLILAGICAFVSFGIIVLAYPTLVSDNTSLFNLSKVVTEFRGIPQRNTGGAALMDLETLSFFPARSLGIGIIFVLIYFIKSSWKNIKIKILLSTLLLGSLALIEESIFLVIIIALSGMVFLSFINFFRYLKRERNQIFIILVFTILLSTFQGGFISESFADFFHHQDPSFNLILPFINDELSNRFFLKLNKFSTIFVYLSSTNYYIHWVVLNPFIFVLIAFLYSSIKKNVSIGLLSLTSVSSFILYFSLEYKYFTENNVRFNNLGYVFSGLTIIYTLFLIFRNLSLKKNIIALVIFIILIFVPTLVPELYFQSNRIKEALAQDVIRSNIGLRYYITPFEKFAKVSTQLIPTNARLVSLDVDSPGPNRSLDWENFGIYTVYAPNQIKVLRQEPGPEYIDLILTLNPSLIKETSTDYIYIETNSKVYRNLPELRKKDLTNNNFFTEVYSEEIITSNETYFLKLYQVKEAFLGSSKGGKDIYEGTLDELKGIISNKDTVYVSDYYELSFWFRMAAILALEEKQLKRNPTLTDYMAIETIIKWQPGFANEEYDYYLLPPEEVPTKKELKLIWSSLFANLWTKK